MAKKEYTFRVELIQYITVEADNFDEGVNLAHNEARKLGDYSDIIIDEGAGAQVKDLETDEEYSVNEFDEVE